MKKISKPKPLNRVTTEALERGGWKRYEGSNPIYQSAWLNEEQVIFIYPSSMKGMYHVEFATNGERYTGFVNQPILDDIIRTKQPINLRKTGAEHE